MRVGTKHNTSVTRRRFELTDLTAGDLRLLAHICDAAQPMFNGEQGPMVGRLSTILTSAANADLRVIGVPISSGGMTAHEMFRLE